MSASRQGGGPIRVMLVDDDDRYRETLRQILALDTDIIVVDEAASGEDIVERVTLSSPHVVAMDIRMPHVDGLLATRRIWESDSPAKVIVLTHYPQYKRYAKALGATECLDKLDAMWQGHMADAIHRVAHGTEPQP